MVLKKYAFWKSSIATIKPDSVINRFLTFQQMTDICDILLDLTLNQLLNDDL